MSLHIFLTTFPSLCPTGADVNQTAKINSENNIVYYKPDVSLIKNKVIRLRAYLICEQKDVENYAVTLQLSSMFINDLLMVGRPTEPKTPLPLLACLIYSELNGRIIMK